MATTPEQLEQISQWIQDSERILIITGAGVSADSGMPTYRGIGGLYNQDATPDGLPIEILLSYPTLRQKPELCWKYIAQLESNCRFAKPNNAHFILAQLEKLRPNLWILTQNVDGLHKQAGSRNIIEIHGNFEKLVCIQCGANKVVTSYEDLELPPRCTSCGGIIRPDVTLFGEALPKGAVTQLHTQLMLGFDLILTIGTTSSFPYIVEPVENARRGQTPTVEINPGITEVSHLVDIRLEMGAKDALEAIWNQVSPHLHHTP